MVEEKRTGTGTFRDRSSKRDISKRTNLNDLHLLLRHNKTAPNMKNSNQEIPLPTCSAPELNLTSTNTGQEITRRTRRPAMCVKPHKHLNRLKESQKALNGNRIKITSNRGNGTEPKTHANLRWPTSSNTTSNTSVNKSRGKWRKKHFFQKLFLFINIVPLKSDTISPTSF